jgi:hypothetical protein
MNRADVRIGRPIGWLSHTDCTRLPVAADSSKVFLPENKIVASHENAQKSRRCRRQNKKLLRCASDLNQKDIFRVKLDFEN